MPLQAIAIGDYLLARHPLKSFCYVQPIDLAQTPWILMGDYQPNVTGWICAHVPQDSRVLLVGGGQGYHALSLASQLDASGRVLALTLDPALHAVFELNIKLHKLDGIVDICSTHLDALNTVSPEMRSSIESFAPSLTILELPSQASFGASILENLGIGEAFAFDDDGVSRMPTAQADASESRKAA